MGSRRTRAALRRRAGIALAVWAIAFGMLAVASAIPEGPNAVLRVSTMTPAVGETVHFDASGSTGHDEGNGRIVAYRFAFGDGQSTEWQTSPFTDHAYADVGAYTATVTVRDLRHQEGAASVTLRVGSAPPTNEFPDLRPVQGRITPRAPVVNDSVNVTVVLLNQGAAAADGAVLVLTDIRPDGSEAPLNRTSLPAALPPAKTESVTLGPFRAFPAGNHTLRIVVTDVTPTEPATGDNVLTLPMAVASAESPGGNRGPPAFEVSSLVVGFAAAGVAAVVGAAYVLLRRPPTGPLEPPPPSPPDRSPPPIWPP